MRTTVATDSAREMASGPGDASSSFGQHQNGAALAQSRIDGEWPLPPSPRRRLSSALADLGPVRPVNATNGDLAPFASGSGFPDLNLDVDVDDPSSRTSLSGLGGGILDDGDVAGGEIVRALAAVGVAAPANGTPSLGQELDLLSGPELLHRGPMIIERARVAQELGVMAPMPSIPRPSPIPALAVGFLLSLATGALLYLGLVGG